MQHKTAYVLLHKLREALAGARDESPLEGDVHVDGAYVGGSVRPENQNTNKRCILAMVIEKEAQAAMAVLAPRFIVPGSTVSADESDAYDPMHTKYDMRRVNHSREYRAEDGTTNRGELLQPLPPDALRTDPQAGAEVSGPLRPRSGVPRKCTGLG